MTEKIKMFFGEYAHINENEKDEARSYLNSWKKFLLRRLHRDSYNVRIIEEQWGEVPAHFMGALCLQSKLYLKLFIELEWKYTDEGSECNGMVMRE